MKNNNCLHLNSKVLIFMGLLFFIFTSCNEKSIDTKNTIKIHEKQKGAHVFGLMDTTNLQYLRRNNIEWVTLVAWGFQEDYDSPLMKHHNGDSTMIIEGNRHWLERLQKIRAAGFKVFVKPHVWIDNTSDGKWRSDIYPTSEENWELWKESYRDFMMRYAQIAELAQVEMFCIGTEFTRLTLEKPEYWKALIQEVRSIYSGKITYAANWYKEYEEITFWDDLDYIGIQAYFPLTKNEYPTTQQVSKGWKKYMHSIKTVHKKYNKKVLFTELGYKSTSDSAVEPWAWINDENPKKSYSLETQANCYEAFFNTIWQKEWFSGVHIWQLRDDGQGNKRENKLDFVPLYKPAEAIIARGFE